MDPATMATMAIGGNIIGGGLDIFGKLAGAGAKSNQYKYQAHVAGMNEQIAKQNANYAIHAGEVEALKSGRKTAYNRGQAKVMKAAGNLRTDFGTSADLQESIQRVGREDQSIIRANAGRRAYGHLVEAEGERAKGEQAKIASKFTKKAGYLDAAASFIGTASSVSSKWLQAKQMGIYGSEAGGDSAYQGSSELFELY